jgi:hypothetical protein
MANLRNLSRRLPKPALNRGRVQRGALRALWVLGIVSTSEIAEWTHARARAYGELSDNHTRAVRHAHIALLWRQRAAQGHDARRRADS